MKHLAKTFKALADETRLELMALILSAGELCVCDCMQVLGISQSKASRHLRYLTNAGLLVDKRVGVWVHYMVPEDLAPLLVRIVSLLREELPGRLDPELNLRLDELRAAKASGENGCPPVFSGPGQ